MRVINFKSAILSLIILALLIGGAFAQQGRMQMKDRPFKGQRFENCPKIPDLTEEQQEQIKKLKTEHMKMVLPLKNQVREKQPQLETVSTGDNVDMNKVNKNIEEIGALKVQMAKKREAHRQEIRKLLTEDQRVFFDSRPRGRGKGNGQGRPGMGSRGRMNNR